MSIPVSIDPLGTLGASPLPPGYTALENAVFNGNTAVDTEINIATPVWFSIEFQPTVKMMDNVLLGWRDSATKETRVGIGMLSSSSVTNVIYFGRGVTFPASESRHMCRYERMQAELRLAPDEIYTAYNGEPLVRLPEEEYSAGLNPALAISSQRHLWLGGANIEGAFSLGYTGKVFDLKFKDESGRVVADIRPALHNGAPCFYDVVRKFELTVVHGALQQ